MAEKERSEINIKVVLLIVGGVIITLILMLGILAALIYPAIGRSNEVAKQVRCMNQMKQITMAIFMYAADYANAMPPDLAALHNEGYLGGDTSLFDCPSSHNIKMPTLEHDYTYLPLPNITNINSDSIILYEKNIHRDNMVNVAYGDGHVESLEKDELERRIISQ